MAHRDEPAADSPAEADPSGAGARTRRGRHGRGGGEAANVDAAGNMLPSRGRRRLGVERLLVRLIATVGVVGIGVILGAILTANHVAGWIIGLVIALVTVVLSAVLWSSRQV